MSRHIHGTPRLEKDDELYQKTKLSDKILIFRNKGILYSFLLQGNRIYRAAREEKVSFPIGTVLIGKVGSVAKQLNGVFVFMENPKGKKGAVGFLPIKENVFYPVLNRKPDGRILAGDEIPVQVIKEAQKSKPYQLTSEISLAGRFVVVKKGTGRVDFSLKSREEEKKKLEDAFLQWKSEKNELLQDIDVKFRTEAPYVEKELWEAEITDCISQLNNIDRISQNRTVYSILKKSDSFYIDFIRNISVSAIEEIVTDEEEVFIALKQHPYTGTMQIRLYQDDRISLQSVYSIKTKLEELLSKKVYMKSGAYLWIEQTEALISIDVNSGKAEKKTDSESFYFGCNLEAAKEVCYQIAARNLSGIIIVDFINMKEKEHITALLNALREETKKDFVPTYFVDYTKLGLAELTRKKTEKPLRDVVRDWEFN